jgi:hypothetical protein
MDAAALAAANVQEVRNIPVAAPPSPTPPPPAPVVIARTPAQEFENTGDAKIFAKATEKLPTTFSLATPNITVLLSELLVRTKSSSWTTLFQMLINGNNLEFLDHYGRVTLAELKTHVNTFVNAAGRIAQNDYMLYLCLAASVDTNTKETMQEAHNLYLAGANNAVESGLLYLKKLLLNAEADTLTTTEHARANFTRLDTYMANLAGSDVTEFHKYVLCQKQTLTARGETTNDIVSNLFKGYQFAKCAKFCDYMDRKKEAFRDGTIDYTVESLMITAENKFNDLKLDGDWEVLTESEKTILALRAQITAKKNERTPKKDGEEFKGGPSLPPAERFTGKLAWKAVAPKAGTPTLQTVGKTVYHWCPHHCFWTVDKPEECTLAKNVPAGPPAATNQPTPPRRMTFAEAAAALVEDDAKEESKA